MPFSSSFDDIYKLGIKASAEEAGAYCERVDEQYYQERILERIYNQIATADIIVADMSSRNPNVFYETGYAHALNKKVILLVSKSKDIPFDLKHHHHIVYNGKISFLKDELKKRLIFFINNPTTESSLTIEGLRFSINGIKLEPEVEIHLEEAHFNLNPALLVQIDIQNTLGNLFNTGFEISLECASYLFYNKEKSNNFSPIIISEKRVIHRGGRIERILPLSYTSKAFLLTPKKDREYRLKYTKYPFILRVGNEIQLLKIPFTIRLDKKDKEFLL